LDAADAVSCEPIERHPGSDFFRLAAGLLGSARTEVLVVSSELSDFGFAEIEGMRRRIAALPSRGVTLSLMCHPDSYETDDRQRFLAAVSRLPNAEVRISAIALQGTLVFDRSVVLVWNKRRDRDCLLMRSPTAVAPFVRLTDVAWTSACDLASFEHWRNSATSARVAEILRLLGSGCKDDVAARDLGVSVRTYRRWVADVMASLNAGSRFQAGAKAAALGLLGDALS
jgi:hypothetical protein